ncbi:hypothetical protein ILUMI_07092 [Ignelater luminosus]|uniref:DDE-1 domain-containing protein n=1 Tax=Ignelater luminosus TaxID=2038154 RepID=A0A8K0D824_IGNLU|nr:hypothetical protein ILUMI_07092 [Ignelater luminosus]
MQATYKRSTAREWDATNTPKAIEAVLQNKLAMRNAAEEFEEKKSRLAFDKDHPGLLIIDNHKLHLSVKALEFAKGNEIAALTLLPHTFHKLQPLDKTVFGLFKKSVASDIDFMFSFASDRKAHSVASTSAAQSTYASMATFSTTNHSAQATRVSPQEGNFPVAEISAATIPAQLSRKIR